MDSLNQILIEGTVTEKTEKHDATWLEIKSVRYEKNIEETTYFMICAPGALGKACDKLEAGRGIRVIGRLTHDVAGKIYVLAKYVIFKPEGADYKK
jgi:hypothetical protein